MTSARGRGGAVAAVLVGALLGTSALADDVPAEAVLATLPFLSEPGSNRVMIDLSPEDSARRFPMVLDTGATGSILTPGMARQLGVSVRRHKSSPYRRPTVLGRDLQFWIDDRSSDSASKTGWEYGLLGGEFLREYVLELDFQGRRVRFLHPKRYEVPEEPSAAGDVVQKLHVVANRPHLDVLVNGEKLRMLVDTGDPFSASVMGKTARKFQIETAEVLGLQVWGVLGPLDVTLGEAESFSIGPEALDRVPLMVEAGNYNQGGSTGAVLGYDVLAQFLVRIDYKKRRVLLRRNPEAVMAFGGIPWADFQRTGIAWIELEGGRSEAVWVIEGSAGARLGVRPGDQIGAGQLERLGIGPEALASHIAGGGGLVVTRGRDGGAVEVALPGAEKPQAGATGEAIPEG